MISLFEMKRKWANRSLRLLPPASHLKPFAVKLWSRGHGVTSRRHIGRDPWAAEWEEPWHGPASGQEPGRWPST